MTDKQAKVVGTTAAWRIRQADCIRLPVTKTDGTISACLFLPESLETNLLKAIVRENVGIDNTPEEKRLCYLELEKRGEMNDFQRLLGMALAWGVGFDDGL